MVVRFLLKILWPSLVLCLALSSVSKAEPLHLYTVLFPPFSTVNQDGDLTGYGVEVVQAIQQRLQSSAQSSDYQGEIMTVPAARARLLLDKQPNTMVFSMYASDGHKRKVGPIAITRVQVFGRAVKETRAPQASTFALAVEAQTYPETLLENRGAMGFVEVSARGGGPITQSLIRMLMNERIDGFAATAANVRYEMSRLKVESERFHVLHELGDGELFLAFHKDVSPAIVSQWQDAFDSMLADRTLADIYRKYAASQFRIPLQD